ncbi:MAG: HlyC/CorC family transporter [Nitrosomonadaceae bacterium]|nr:HlyC/CorC family transporter [Nitrosomonadaceae bacterium]MDW7597764.1 HlyC/CorC family transporter [Nitrosomonadaceae bacterium]MDW7619236.1 HlyC/CorC family transporter [Nitrosomonadaceae bacterium]MDW7647496.1 HlyC/CorC family transporter [Nitrosomonadaceae bacterium]MDW7666531.1 HlyC/CorC family transporter [Nitrosomonadaceae bacterium]
MPLYELLIALVVLLILSAFFSLSETSMMAINRYRLKHLVKQGHHGARLTTQLLANTDRLLGVILLGNNLLNAAAATLVAVIVSSLFDHSDLALLLGTVCVTFAILVFSEITPKVIAAAYPERIALASSYVLSPLLKLFYPIVWFVNLFVQGLLTILRLKPGADSNTHKISPEELKTLVLEAGHFIRKKHQSMLLNLFDLETITVDDVMVPRSQIEAINLDDDDAAIQNQLLTCYHTRLPAYRGTLDNVIGVIHTRRVLNQMKGGGITSSDLEKIIRKPYFIPSGTPLFSQLQLFQENRERVGLVVNEYGEWMGIVTLDDIIEEIIGEFTTHSPSQASSFLAQEDGSIIVKGTSLLRDLNRKLGMRLPLDGPKTLNGLIVEYFQDIPESGTSLKIAGHQMEIIQTQGRVVKMVRILAVPTE